MPIVDGLTATIMIREIESKQTGTFLSYFASLNDRVPIFAVSASLQPQYKKKYVEAGFDGWILKPVDFARLEYLMLGIVDSSKRDGSLVTKIKWEQGGWFTTKKMSQTSPPSSVQ
jgi:CheY-like chemotaxis protein